MFANSIVYYCVIEILSLLEMCYIVTIYSEGVLLMNFRFVVIVGIPKVAYKQFGTDQIVSVVVFIPLYSSSNYFTVFCARISTLSIFLVTGEFFMFFIVRVCLAMNGGRNVGKAG